MRFISNLLFLTIYFGLVNFSFAQQKVTESAFSSKTDYFGVTYYPPKDFTPFEGNHSYSCGPAEGYFNALNYTIISTDSSIVIGFSLIKAYNKIQNENLKTISPKYDFNTNYIRTAKQLADTVHNKIVMYKSEYSKKKFNADDAGEYYHSCLALYDNKYPFKKVVFGFKKDIAQFEITYFYTEKSKTKVDDIIKKTAGIIKFNDLPPAEK